MSNNSDNSDKYKYFFLTMSIIIGTLSIIILLSELVIPFKTFIPGIRKK